jgi:hypothetical protein
VIIHSNSQDAMVYARAAEMHREASRTLILAMRGVARSLVGCEIVYLSGYIAECILKAVLISYTPVAKRSRMLEDMLNPNKIGHDLELIRRQLSLRNCHLPAEPMRSLRFVRSHWSSQLRYSARAWSMTDAVTVHAASDVLYQRAMGGQS